MLVLDWTWVPHKSIGPLNFDCVQDLDLLPFPYHEVITDDCEYKTYEVNSDGTRFYVRNQVLESVECRSMFMFKNVNFIGMKVDELVDFLGPYSSIINHSGFGDEIAYSDLGLIIWFDGFKVESISVSS